VNNKSAQVLLLFVIPGHLIFLYTIHLMKSGHTSLTVVFVVVYLFAAVLQVRWKPLKISWAPSHC
jgi:solute carrier family 41